MSTSEVAGQAVRPVRPAARELVARLPLEPGVYRFRDISGRVLYLGRATILRRRVASYWGDLGARAHLAPMVSRIARIEAAVCDSAHEAAWLERNLLQTRTPPWNRVSSGGQEVEVWIRLSDSGRCPGIEVVHQPVPGARHFGPYLGGRQVRLAVSGLCRILPLAYAGDGPAGAAADMARVRGVSAADRARLAETAAAALARDETAVAEVRARLADRRAAASSALAFEFAARLHEEMAALDWVTAAQKVTSDRQPDADACGWADGILVRFEIRGGRVTGWTQRTCGDAAARRQLAQTPPHWSAFAQRNAELAASLGGWAGL